MKKQYDTKRLTDELSKSVFFQVPEPPDKHAPEQNQMQESSPQAALELKQQVTKAPKLQSDKAQNNQITKETKQASTKALSDQSTQAGSNRAAKAPKLHAAKPLKHFSSYLAPGTYKAWKLLATEREKKDYEVLQEAVEQYLEREQKREMKIR